MNTASLQTEQKKWWHLSLTKQIFLGLIVGILAGWLAPQFSSQLSFVRDIFLRLIKSIIAPLVFSTIVIGIAGGGDLKKVGRMGVLPCKVIPDFLEKLLKIILKL